MPAWLSLTEKAFSHCIILKIIPSAHTSKASMLLEEFSLSIFQNLRVGVVDFN